MVCSMYSNPIATPSSTPEPHRFWGYVGKTWFVLAAQMRGMSPIYESHRLYDTAGADPEKNCVWGGGVQSQIM